MSVTTGCHSPAAAAGVVLSMAPHGGSEMAAPPEDPDERRKRRNYLILIVVWALAGVGFLLCSRFITGLPRWARTSSELDGASSGQ